ncbi:MAG TPA: tetratricopeptide repeat protein [Desulfobacterales bacterium]|nr:tetratricopeptide repeat protein [Desulfobacterales bacterium]
MQIMRKIKNAFIFVGIIAILYFAFRAYSYLSEMYCWNCTSQEYFDKGSTLICMEDKKNKNRGLDFIHSAAKKGNVDAQIFLGELHMESFPENYHIFNKEKIQSIRMMVPIDKKKAISHFNDLLGTLPSAKGDYRNMQYNLGVFFKTGFLESKSKEEQAKKWFALSAEAGNPDAMFELGLYYNALGDYDSAKKWFTNAYNAGKDPASAIMIGDYYFYSKGVVKDYDQSIQWYQNALNVLAEPDVSLTEKRTRQLIDNASQRLKIAHRKIQEKLQKQVVHISYSIEGSIRNYLIYTPEICGRPIGEIKMENGVIKASIKENILFGSAPMTKEVASMSKGLSWVLNTYAKDKYGAASVFNFVLKKK